MLPKAEGPQVAYTEGKKLEFAILVLGKVNLAQFLTGWRAFPIPLKPRSEVGVYFIYSQCRSCHFML